LFQFDGLGAAVDLQNLNHPSQHVTRDNLKAISIPSGTEPGAFLSEMAFTRCPFSGNSRVAATFRSWRRKRLCRRAGNQVGEGIRYLVKTPIRHGEMTNCAFLDPRTESGRRSITKGFYRFVPVAGALAHTLQNILKIK